MLDEAARLFMQLGYSAVSINDIVKAAEVTKPTLYYYFPDKAELFVQMALQRLVQLHAALDAGQAGAYQHGSSPGILRGGTAQRRRWRYADMLRHEMAEHLPPEHQARLAGVSSRPVYATP
ncbi:MAG: helix-turn-helix domain-containing protein [Kouleothrix sp.]